MLQCKQDVWMEREGTRLSTLDLFGSHFVLLVGEDEQGCYDAAQKIAARLGIGLDAYRIGPSGNLIDLDGRWFEMYGITTCGAILVRPDGFVGWRSKDGEQEPERMFEHVMDHLLCRSD